MAMYALAISPFLDQLRRSSPGMVCRWCHRSINFQRSQTTLEWTDGLWSFWTPSQCIQDISCGGTGMWRLLDICRHRCAYIYPWQEPPWSCSGLKKPSLRSIWTTKLRHESSRGCSIMTLCSKCSICTWLWKCLQRTVSDITNLLLLLPENAIHQYLIPALTGCPPCSCTVRDLLALPIQLGGLDICDPSATSSECFCPLNTSPHHL